MSFEQVGIVHERFTEMGGSEKVVEALGHLWPSAHLYSPLVDRGLSFPAVELLDHSSSWLQHFYMGGGRYSHLLPLIPAAMRSLDLSDCDLVITSHHAFSNRALNNLSADAKSISYVHTPARWLWDANMRSADTSGAISRSALNAFAASQRKLDHRSAQRPDIILANSTAVADRVREWWDRDSTVVHPPVDVNFYTPAEIPREEFFLLAGRLVPYKRPELAIAAAAKAGVRLVVAGDGRYRQALQAQAGPTVEFLGEVTGEELRHLFRTCRAMIFPGIEDFGIIPVEAQACGAPVLAIDAGGLQDTVLHGKTGILVSDSADDGEVIADLAHAMTCSLDGLSSESATEWAQHFSYDRFGAEMRNVAASL